MPEEDSGGGAVKHGLAGLGVLLVGLARVCSSGGDELVRVGAQVGRQAAEVGHVGGALDDVARGAVHAGAWDDAARGAAGGGGLEDAARPAAGGFGPGGGFGPRGATLAEPHPPASAATQGAADGAEHGHGVRDAVEKVGDAADLIPSDDDDRKQRP